MTAIAYRDGILAADTARWHGDVKVSDDRKIFRLPDGSLFAGSGAVDIIKAYVAWKSGQGDKPEPAEKEEDFGGILVTKDGVKIVGGAYREYMQEADFYAEGSPVEFLYGAMAAGASAEEAIRLAIRHCKDAGGNVQVERIGSSMPS
jgi:hypothetical protein